MSTEWLYLLLQALEYRRSAGRIGRMPDTPNNFTIIVHDKNWQIYIHWWRKTSPNTFQKRITFLKANNNLLRFKIKKINLTRRNISLLNVQCKNPPTCYLSQCIIFFLLQGAIMLRIDKELKCVINNVNKTFGRSLVPCSFLKTCAASVHHS